MKKVRAFCLLLLISGCQSALPPSHNLSYQLPSSNRSDHKFFSYLTNRNPLPALIAYSPTNFDPRQGKYVRVPSPSSIERDLRQLRVAFDGLILYGYHPDITPVVVEKAFNLHFRAIMLGIWSPQALVEVNGVLKLIREYEHHMAMALCIGNEGLSFHRYSMADLLTADEHIRSVLRDHSPVPMTTSEPLSTYRRSDLLAFGDFLAPNIHPVFDQPTLTAVDAATWTRAEALALMEKSHKPVLVKETGFPHGGRKQFTPQTQKKFWEAYLGADRLVNSHEYPGAWTSFATSFEAFSQPWKAEESGLLIEAAWGLMNKDRQPFPAFYTWSQQYSSTQ